MPNSRFGTLALAIAFWLLPAMAHADQVLLHAAGSLRTALDQIAATYEKATGTHVVAK